MTTSFGIWCSAAGCLLTLLQALSFFIRAWLLLLNLPPADSSTHTHLVLRCASPHAAQSLEYYASLFVVSFLTARLVACSPPPLLNPPFRGQGGLSFSHAQAWQRPPSCAATGWRVLHTQLAARVCLAVDRVV
jgi:hypothetical protein